MKNIKKILVILLIFVFVGRLSLPVAIFADSTPTDTPPPTTTVTDTPAPTADPSPTATLTDTPTPTPDPTAAASLTPTDSPTPTNTPPPSQTLDASNSADVGNGIANSSNTGGNSIDASASAVSTDSATPTPTQDSSQGASSTNTGNATASTSVTNDVNTTSVNSQYINQTINIFLPQDGNITLSDPTSIAQQVAADTTSPVINVSLTTNGAVVSNNVVSIADTGNNSASGSGTFAINTGNAYSLVQLINKVNLTLVNSNIHFITINIYGELNGNIVLPELVSSQNCTSCGSQTTVNNNATVTNAVTNAANTGTNTITATGGTNSISTGNAQSMVNLINIINSVIFGVSYGQLFINDLGTWNGKFVGWGNLPALTGGTSLALSTNLPTNGSGNPCAGCTTITTINNQAQVNNTVSSLANTGNNTGSGSSGTITTGSAYSIISLLNFINSNFINTSGFFAFINIFGTWNGDIGGVDHFPTPTPAPEVASNSPATYEDGGQLSLTNDNNVGAYVLPGDTVTFFVQVKNPGTGKVRNVHLHLSLMKNGIETGGADFSLPDIDAGHTIKLSTGLVLSKSILGGQYDARATATGTTGNSTGLSAQADSTFAVFTQDLLTDTGSNLPPVATPAKTVLAAHTAPTPQSDNALLLDLWLVLAAYLTIRIMKNRKVIIAAFSKSYTFKERLSMVRLFLF
ncbi:MAG TPA: hypothetical protein VFQ63_04235 [Patescibacteria group bacterium]|nr:hypothetical protein [Patescibacteria group bacterium]